MLIMDSIPAFLQVPELSYPGKAAAEDTWTLLKWEFWWFREEKKTLCLNFPTAESQNSQVSPASSTLNSGLNPLLWLLEFF